MIEISFVIRSTRFYDLAIDNITQSARYERLSKNISPHLLLLHKLTSGQQLVPYTIPCSAKQFQLEIKPSIQLEFASEIFLLKYQSSVKYQNDVLQQISFAEPIDSKMKILKTEIDYLKKQYAESIAIDDYAQQLATEQTISSKLQIIESLHEKQQLLKDSKKETRIYSPVDNQVSTDNTKLKASIRSSTVIKTFLDADQFNKQIREVLKAYVNILHKHIRSDQLKVSERQYQIYEASSSRLEDNQKEFSGKQIINSENDLRQLSIFFKKKTRSNLTLLH